MNECEVTIKLSKRACEQLNKILTVYRTQFIEPVSLSELISAIIDDRVLYANPLDIAYVAHTEIVNRMDGDNDEVNKNQ